MYCPSGPRVPAGKRCHHQPPFRAVRHSSPEISFPAWKDPTNPREKKEALRSIKPTTSYPAPNPPRNHHRSIPQRRKQTPLDRHNVRRMYVYRYPPRSGCDTDKQDRGSVGLTTSSRAPPALRGGDEAAGGRGRLHHPALTRRRRHPLLLYAPPPSPPVAKRTRALTSPSPAPFAIDAVSSMF